MLREKNILPPPWIAFPEFGRDSVHWRMDVGEWYMCEKWIPWLQALSAEERAEYIRLFPEPFSWRGFLTEDKECEALCTGSLRVELWREKGLPKYSAGQLSKALRAGEKPEFVMFWGHEPRVPGVLDNACMSQWWKSDFVYRGVDYCCMEQCMMAGKAMAFEDEETLRKILESDDPRKIKALGRQVKPFDPAVWDKVKLPLILGGNYQKFAQDPGLRSFLLATGDSVLVEASPYDQVWGIGLPADDPRSRQPRLWQGTNLLGFALMEVRDELRRVFANAELCIDPIGE